MVALASVHTLVFFALFKNSISSAFTFRLKNNHRKICSCNMETFGNGDEVAKLTFRHPLADDIPACFEIESASYPEDEAASLASLEYRQAHALPYFQVALLDETIVGFVCSTRCAQFEAESMSKHTPNGPLLAIHSVVVQEKHRRLGIASAMLRQYLKKIQEENGSSGSTIQSIVLLSKSHLLGFYVNCGFQVNRPSPIVHGQELWFELEKKMVRTLPITGEESWFCKTEQFKRPFPEVKPYLEAHKIWVNELRQKGHCITSGYRVDSQGKPGGGGLMFLAAKNYDEAHALVLQDPLVANSCVDWALNGWIGQVGDIQMR